MTKNVLIDEQNNKKLIWDLKDYSDWGIEYIDTSISDWDSDGVAETSVIYFLEKMDLSPENFSQTPACFIQIYTHPYLFMGDFFIYSQICSIYGFLAII